MCLRASMQCLLRGVRATEYDIASLFRVTVLQLFCDQSMREKAWRSRKPGLRAQAHSLLIINSDAMSYSGVQAILANSESHARVLLSVHHVCTASVQNARSSLALTCTAAALEVP